MKLALMQPYFFPYLGYFSLIRDADEFIFFDTVQYMRKGWGNRNRILHPKGGANYITVPIKKAPRQTAIRDIHVDHTADWSKDILAKLETYKKKAPHYQEVVALIRECFDKPSELLSALNIHSTVLTCEYIGLPLKSQVWGEMSVAIDEVTAPDEWGLNVTKALGFDAYTNPHGGTEFFDREKYAQEGIDLTFVKNRLTPYSQRRDSFEPGLSIIDVLMFCSPEETRVLIDDYELL
ncbi:MAG: WbqC family protein [Coriobacteriales bacterium]|jgi:hypothetical protein|nr:WbqC family protein [Coriobacteriales bacterium]